MNINADKFLRPDDQIQQVSVNKLNEILDSVDRSKDTVSDYTPYGLFYAYDDGVWVAIDNSAGDAFTEEFSTEEQAIAWLNGEFEVFDEDSFDDDVDGDFF